MVDDRVCMCVQAYLICVRELHIKLQSSQLILLIFIKMPRTLPFLELLTSR